MQETMRGLLTAQEIDTEIRGARKGLEQIPLEHEAIEAAIVLARESVTAAKSLLEQEELEERKLESQMRDQEALLRKLDGQSSQVTSTQAYEALQHEIEHANSLKSEFETRALELMEAIDSAKSDLAEFQSKWDDLESASPGQLADLASRESGLGDQLADLANRRSKAATDIDPKILARYERILAKLHPAVCVLTGKSCPECRMVLPRQAYSEIRRGEQIHSCTSCMRLMVPEHMVGG
jgi:predicted  nucleic acid-binding Zn-ribbon protein